MKEKSALARPYAKAVFEFALQHDALEKWSVMLNVLSQIILHKKIQAAINNPKFSVEQLAELIESLAADFLNEYGHNFIRLLAERKRLVVLPIITNLFQAYCAEYEGTISIKITSALPVESDIQARFTSVLQQTLKRGVSLEYDVDATLIGGAIIRAGDFVIDGSVRGKLTRLAECLGE